MKAQHLSVLLLLCVTLFESCFGAGLVISHIYGGAGCGTSSCSTFKNDFVVIYNAGCTAQSLSGHSIQYAVATGTTWTVTNLPSYTLQPGAYFLVAQVFGSNGVNNIPTADATGTIAMDNAGKLLLASTTTAFTGQHPFGASILDKVGYGATANSFEGSYAPAPSTTTLLQRKVGGCTDSNNNGNDFQAVSAAGYTIPNTATTAKKCLSCSCSAGAQCQSSFCADSRCCSAACTGSCEQCNAAGTCEAVTSGQPVSPRPSCAGSGFCLGECNVASRTTCTYPDSGTQCSGESCAAAILTNAGFCDGAGSCATTTTPCAPWACATPSSCATDGSSSGDPVFRGFNNQAFIFDGRISGIYNVYSDQHLYVNSQFEAANPSNNIGTINKNVVIKGNTFSVAVYGASKQARVNDVIVNTDSFINVTDCVTVRYVANSRVEIHTPDHEIKVMFRQNNLAHLNTSYLDLIISIDVVHAIAHRELYGGLLGSTLDAKWPPATWNKQDEGTQWVVKEFSSAVSPSNVYKSVTMECTANANSVATHKRRAAFASAGLFEA